MIRELRRGLAMVTMFLIKRSVALARALAFTPHCQSTPEHHAEGIRCAYAQESTIVRTKRLVKFLCGNLRSLDQTLINESNYWV